MALAGGVAVVTSWAGNEDEPTSDRQLRVVQQRIERARSSGELGRIGVYVVSNGRGGRPCVAVALANPTRPNVEYVERRFRGTCVERRGFQREQACSERPIEHRDIGTVSVPNVGDLELYDAERVLVAAGLTFTFDCLGDRHERARRPSASEPERLARIVAQCPRPGERVRPGTEVALNAAAELPGGFVFRREALNFYNTGTRRPCPDGRHPARPGR